MQLNPEEIEKRKSINKRIVKFGCLPIISFFILLIIIGSLSDHEDSKNLNKDFSDSSNYSLVIKNTDILKKRFNSFAGETKMSFRINNIKITDGSSNKTFTYMLNDYVALLGQINKDNSVRSISMLAKGDGTSKSGLNMVMTMTAIIAITNPDLKPKDRGEIIESLGLLKEDVDINNLSGSTIRNGVKYFITSSETTGVIFGAQSADDN